MDLTPLDIQQKTFPVTFRGYDREDVTAFLEEVRRHYERVVQQNVELTTRLNDVVHHLMQTRVRERDALERLEVEASSNNDNATLAVHDSDDILEPVESQSALQKSIDIVDVSQEIQSPYPLDDDMQAFLQDVLSGGLATSETPRASVSAATKEAETVLNNAQVERDELLQDAQREADRVVRRAKRHAQEAIDDAHEDLEGLEREIEVLLNQRDRLYRSMRSTLYDHLRLLDTYEELSVEQDHDVHPLESAELQAISRDLDPDLAHRSIADDDDPAIPTALERKVLGHAADA